ncbi:MAG: nuclear transport factor 2 family protein [Vitreoscilla sp.]
MKTVGVLTLVFLALQLTACASAQPGGGTEASTCAPSAEANRRIVLAFYDQALVKRQTRAAFERYASEDFVEHKTSVPVGTRAATIDFLEDLVKQAPDPQWQVVRTIAEGDLVFLHARFVPVPGAPEFAIGDVFRLNRCKLVEHWDIIGLPVKDQRNPNSRF